MQPKADIVLKECRLNQSEAVYCLCMNLFNCSISVVTETQFAIQTQPNCTERLHVQASNLGSLRARPVGLDF